MRYLEDLVVGEPIACGRFRLTRDEIIAFAELYDPQPFHLDESYAQSHYFAGLCASGVQTQAMALGMMVRALGPVAFIAGRTLHEARFFAAVRPDAEYSVEAQWTALKPHPRHHDRGDAMISGISRDADGVAVMNFGVTYVVGRRVAGI